MFEFAWPWLFILVPLPWLIRRFSPALQQQDVALSTPFYNELDDLQRAHRHTVPLWRSQAALYAVLWLLLLCASARPQIHGSLTEQPTTGRDLLIALDVSSSMLYSDMRFAEQNISRMEFVKHWLDNFIVQRHGDRLGLILFGSQAYLQAPLTYDHQSVRSWVQEAQPGIAGNSTSMGDAIGLAIKRLRMRPANHRVLILVTDGANTSGVMSPLAAAQLAARYQIKIYTIGIGSNQTDQLQTLIETASLELDEQALKDIAQVTAGQYFYISDSSDLTDIYRTLNQLEPSAVYAIPKRHIQELYSWPLAAALLLSMLLVALHAYNAQRHTSPAQESN